jgi:hypothetical protein
LFKAGFLRGKEKKRFFVASLYCKRGAKLEVMKLYLSNNMIFKVNFNFQAYPGCLSPL